MLAFNLSKKGTIKMEPKQTSVVDHNAGQTSPEGTQGSPVPSEATKPVESSETASTGELPEGVSERTQKEFDKLKASNQALKEELDNAPKKESVYDIFRSKPEKLVAPVAPVAPVQPQAASYADEDGNVDVAQFNAAIAQANARADEATRIAKDTQARTLRSEQDRQESEAFAKHPSLNPKSPDFDRNFYNFVEDRLVKNYATGTKTSLVDIADDIVSFYKPTNVEAAKDEAVTEYKKTESKKAVAGSPAGTSKVTSNSEFEDIVAGSNAGVEGSLAQRLKASGI